MAKQKRNDSECWVSRQQAADLLGVHLNTFDVKYRPRIEHGDTVSEGSRKWFRGRAIIDLYREELLEKVAPDGDSLLGASDGDSPALERYRTAKAEQEEYKAAQMRGEMVTVQEVSEGFSLAANVMRRLADELRRKSPESHEALEEAWEDVARIIEDRFGKTGEQPNTSSGE